jgi:hypothetical protein
MIRLRAVVFLLGAVLCVGCQGVPDLHFAEDADTDGATGSSDGGANDSGTGGPDGGDAGSSTCPVQCEQSGNGPPGPCDSANCSRCTQSGGCTTPNHCCVKNNTVTCKDTCP